MARALNRVERDSLVAELVRLLAQINDGQIDASVSMKYRIEGAITALEVASGRQPSRILGLPENEK
jgi:hypothetical protein